MDDNNLITLLQQGDRNAYKQLFIKYYSPLCEYASQYISDDDSEELVQELMLFLWETRENLVIETSLKSYLSPPSIVASMRSGKTSTTNVSITRYMRK